MSDTQPHNHGEWFLLHILGALEEQTLCCFLSLFSGKPAYINNNKSGEGRSVHFLITPGAAAAPKEQRDERAVRSRL